MAIKAIETRYKGYRFRSRLEARWAVFFDALHMQWDYEKEGFDVNGTWYLPDFWLADLDCFAEVKPVPFTPKEETLADACECLMLVGVPAVTWYRWCKEPSFFVHLTYSLYKKRLWFCAGEGIDVYDNRSFQAAVQAARGARFEHNKRHRT